MGTVFETVLTQAVREWDDDGGRHEFRVHTPAHKIYDGGGIITIGSTCRIVVAGSTVRVRAADRKSAAISPEDIGGFVRRALAVADRDGGRR
jgi:hypothetical protein